MSYQQKYLKYKQKYIDLKELVRQRGGEPTIEQLLEGYKEIPNSGQQNCGIFVSDRPLEEGYIIKCESGDRRNDRHLADAIAINNIFQNKGMLLFPQIFDKPIYDATNNKTYIKMERFDGDVTQMLYEHLAKLSIKKLNVDGPTSDALYAVYQFKMPATVGRDDKRLMEKMMLTSANTLKFETYDSFMKQFEEDLRKMLHEVSKQIYTIRMKMIDEGYYYADNKFDNYGFTLSDKNEKHLGSSWENNKIGDKYFFIRLLDWGSGLVKIGNYDEKPIQINFAIEDYNSNCTTFSKYGQYGARALSNPSHMNEDLIKTIQMSDELKKIIDAQYMLNLNKGELDETRENLIFSIQISELQMKIRSLQEKIKKLQKLQELQKLEQELQELQQLQQKK